MIKILNGDCRKTLLELEDASVQCCITSPPYWGLRDYGECDQLGLEPTPEEYVENMVEVFSQVRRVLKDDGTLWLNLGDSYANNHASGGRSESVAFHGSPSSKSDHNTPIRPYRRPDGLKPKDLVGIPWRVAFALQADGWYLRQDIVWNKPNPMPESVQDRCTKSHEYVFLLSKRPKYYYDADAISEEGEEGQRNKRSVWTVNTKPYKDAHFAVFPTKLITPCVLAGTKAGDVILDPFGGSGTTGKVAIENGRKAILCELNPEYTKLIEKRTTTTMGFGF